MINRKNRKYIIIAIVTIGVILEIITYYYFYARNNNALATTDNKISKLNDVNKQIESIEKKDNITQQEWLEEGELLKEQAKLEAEIDENNYYKKQLELGLNTVKAAINDTIHQNEISNSPYSKKYKKSKMWADMLNELYEKYASILNSNDVSFKEEFENFNKEDKDLINDFKEKYSNIDNIVITESDIQEANNIEKQNKTNLKDLLIKYNDNIAKLNNSLENSNISDDVKTQIKSTIEDYKERSDSIKKALNAEDYDGSYTILYNDMSAELLYIQAYISEIMK